MRPLLVALGIVALILCPFAVTNTYYLHLIVTIAIYGILLLGLDIVFGYTGEVSIGHAAFFGIGAYAAGVLIVQAPGLSPEWRGFLQTWGFLVALPLGMIVAAAFGLLLALPALRVTGPYLAMVTLAFGTIVQILINEMDFLTNGPRGVSLRKPFPLDFRDFSDTLPFLDMPLARAREVEYYAIVALALVVTIVLVQRLIASHYGRAFEALRDAPIACDCMGVSVYGHKVIAFVISAALGGLAGVLFAYSEQYIAPNTFGFELSLQFLLAVAIGGRKSRIGPLLGAAIVVFLPNLLADLALFRLIAGLVAAVAIVTGLVVALRDPERRARIAIPVVLCVSFFVFALWLKSITDYKLAVYGAMILFVVYYLPDGITGFVQAALAGFTRRRLSRTPATSGADVAALAAPAAAEPLVVEHLVMRFGGLKALDGVSLSVTPGTIHGLIGPNGSGKSTMMNVLTGLYRPSEGTIRFGAADLAVLKPPRIAALGVARTFQNVQLFGELSLLDNVLVGLDHTFEASLPSVLLGLPRARREAIAAERRAMALLAFVGLAEQAGEQARNLPYGRQRLLEIARALALDPQILLLDEPAAGLTAPDIRDLVAILRQIRGAGITLLLIEHHMDLVMGICDVVTVLDFGQKIAEGTPRAVQSDPRVIEAYLGGSAADAANPAPALAATSAPAD